MTKSPTKAADDVLDARARRRLLWRNLPLPPLLKRVMWFRYHEGLSRTRTAIELRREGFGAFKGAKGVARVEEKALSWLKRLITLRELRELLSTKER